jgi:serine/threonine protein kinase
LYFTEDNKDKRSHFEAMSVRVIADEDKPLSKQLHMKAGSGRTRTVSLLGARAWVLNVATKPGDVQPSFSENSVCIRESVESNRGWIVAHPSATNQRSFLELLCRAGCLVRDLPDHIAFLPEADQPSATLRLARPTSSRTATAAEIVAVKVTAEEDKMTQLLNETNVLLNLQHDGIVRAYGVYEVKVHDERALAMVLDYKMGMDLSYWIPADGLPEHLARAVLAQVCDAMVYLHGLDIVHRDIKPGNVLCERAEDGSVKAVIADFGLATHIMDKQKLAMRCGTGGFVAPEMFQMNWPAQVKDDQVKDPSKIDVFSLGMMTYGLLFGVNPFTASTLDTTYLRNAQCSVSFEDMGGRSAELKSFLTGACAKHPHRRFASSEALAHPWFSADRGASGSGYTVRSHEKVTWAEFERAVND